VPSPTRPRHDISTFDISCPNAVAVIGLAHKRSRSSQKVPLHWPDHDLLTEYAFTTKGTATRITNDAVADCIGQGREVEYGQLVKELSAKHQVCQRTAKSAVKRAADAGVIAKNLGGRYERAA